MLEDGSINLLSPDPFRPARPREPGSSSAGLWPLARPRPRATRPASGHSRGRDRGQHGRHAARHGRAASCDTAAPPRGRRPAEPIAGRQELTSTRQVTSYADVRAAGDRRSRPPPGRQWTPRGRRPAEPIAGRQEPDAARHGRAASCDTAAPPRGRWSPRRPVIRQLPAHAGELTIDRQEPSGQAVDEKAPRELL